jgi:peptidoglycan/LPS O-acetylase OafA/YrhL
MPPTPDQPQRSSYYPFIDGLRAVAILLVLYHHVVFFLVSDAVIPSESVLGRIAGAGKIGVDLFFVISGFLITGVIIDHASGRIRIGRFYQRRFFKIYPQYVACLLACLLFPLLLPRVYAPAVQVYRFDWAHLWPYLVFIQNYVSEPLTTFAHGWSLAIEEHFYVVYPLIIWLVYRHGDEKDRRTRLGITMVILLVLTCAYRFAINMNDPICRITHAPPGQATLMRMDALIAGCLLKLSERYLSRTPKALAPLFLLAGAGLWTSCLIFSEMNEPLYIMVTWAGASGIFIAGLIGWKPLNVLLENTPVRWIGKNSYGIYLWHYPLIFLLAPLADLLPMGYVVAIYLAAVFVFGAGSTATVERIALNFRDRVSP